ncbi:AAA family ATPase [Hokovirus HKV1]|uniref:AAA family ATPase n=1 Tax=Hokovirus HKV1 TaxID=1977638 RepID=A0A1V0SF52_9VIRU|nr:AAA family ATPase [Hokovirus HKV1]
MSNIIIETCNTVLPVLLIQYIPIDDLPTRSILSYPLSKLIIALMIFIFNFVINLMNFIPLHYFQKKYINLDSNMIYYKSFSKYISNKYSDQIKACNTTQTDYNTNFDIVEFCKTTIIDTFDKDNKKYKMHITISNNIFKISCNCSIEIIQEYIKNIHDYIILTCDNYDLIIFKPIIVSDKDNKNFKIWEKNITKTNKRLNNTILSDSVNKNLVDKIKLFLSKSQLQIYNEKGLPYKMGFLLYGEPGTGKTSIIKSIAVEHNLPIFVFGIDILNSTNIINDANAAIYRYISPGTPHIVLIEDLDTTNLTTNCWWDKNNIQVSTLLQLLDGIDEFHGRITFMTANDTSFLSQNSSLIRPGRIDGAIYITFCDKKQIQDILKLHYGPIIDSLIIDDKITITSATLIQIILTIKDLELVIKFINETKKFNKINNNEIINTMNKFINDQKPKELTDSINNIVVETKETRDVKINKFNIGVNKLYERASNTILFNGYSKMYYNILIFIKIFEHNIENYNKLCKHLYKDNNQNDDKDNNDVQDVFNERKLLVFGGYNDVNVPIARITNKCVLKNYDFITHYKWKIDYCHSRLKYFNNLLLIFTSEYHIVNYSHFDVIINQLNIVEYLEPLVSHLNINKNNLRPYDFKYSIDILCDLQIKKEIKLNDDLKHLVINHDYILYEPVMYDYFDFSKMEEIYKKYFNEDNTKKIIVS